MKNILILSIAGLVGLLFLLGGMTAGIRLASMPTLPKPPAPVVVHKSPSAEKILKKITLPADPLDPEALRKTYQALAELNQSLNEKSDALDQRETKIKQTEDELKVEKQNVDNSHQKIADLFAELEKRLVLVESNQVTEIQREVDLYSSMELAQTIDLVRAKEDPDVIRLFSMMENKQLAQIINTWKKKYPDDTPRLLSLLHGMSRVFSKEKMQSPVPSSAPLTASPTSAPAETAPPSPAATAPQLTSSDAKPNP